MASQMPQEKITLHLDLLCPVCRENLAGPTTQGVAKLGLNFQEIFLQLPLIKSRAWGGFMVKHVHRCHLN